MYENLKGRVKRYEESRIAEFDVWFAEKTVGEILSTPFLRSLTTKTTMEALQRSDPSKLPERNVAEKLCQKRYKQFAKSRDEYIEKLEMAEAVEAPSAIDVKVEFKRHPIWNYNPVATVTAGGIVTKGHASGCGYDKESEAVANGMNQNPKIMRILYDYAENGGVFPYGITTFAGVPSFMGGTGINCFRTILEDCGYTWEDVVYESKHRYYYITK